MNITAIHRTIRRIREIRWLALFFFKSEATSNSRPLASIRGSFPLPE